MVKVGELRKQITENAKNTKNKMILSKLTTISDIFRRYTDDVDYATLSEIEYTQISLIFSVLQIQNFRYLRSLKVIADNFLS